MCGVCGCTGGGKIIPPNQLSGFRLQNSPGGAVAKETLAPQETKTDSRLVAIEQNLQSKNNRFAQGNRSRFVASQQRVFNLLSSPGSGKTSLLVRTLNELRVDAALAVIEGDQQSSLDAQRILATGTAAIQINTGKGCHLDAEQIGLACDQLALPDGAIIFIENVGNLVCPAAFDLGEQLRVVVLSVTEGEDKPLKYPDMFLAADLVLINKIDLLPYLDFDLELCQNNIRKLNAQAPILLLSAKTGEGMAAWYQQIPPPRNP